MRRQISLSLLCCLQAMHHHLFQNSYSKVCPGPGQGMQEYVCFSCLAFLTLSNNDPETEDSSWNPKSYERKYFIMDMGCIQTFEYVLVKNSHNHEYRDSSSKIIK